MPTKVNSCDRCEMEFTVPCWIHEIADCPKRKAKNETWRAAVVALGIVFSAMFVRVFDTSSSTLTGTFVTLAVIAGSVFILYFLFWRFIGRHLDALEDDDA